MLLVVTATELEMRPLRQTLAGLPGWTPLVAGVGLLETAVHLSRFLSGNTVKLLGIINCGVAGAYVGAGPGLLDLCLAERETMADFGVGLEAGVEDFAPPLAPASFPLDGPLLARALEILTRRGMRFWPGNFVSVQTASGQEGRGELLRQRHRAICENMEGAAVARVAAEFSLPCLELRAVSNLVRDRDLGGWRLNEAAAACAQAAAMLLPELSRGW